MYYYRYLQEDINTNNEPMIVNCKGHTGTLRVVAFDRLNSSSSVVYAASAGGGDNRPRVWDVNTGMGILLKECIVWYLFGGFCTCFLVILSMLDII